MGLFMEVTLGYVRGKMASADEEGEKEIYSFSNSVGAIETMVKMVTYETRSDVVERRKYNHAFKEGYRKGVNDVKEKFCCRIGAQR